MTKKLDNPKLIYSILTSYIILSIVTFLIHWLSLLDVGYVPMNKYLLILDIILAVLVYIIGVVSTIIIFRKSTKIIYIVIVKIILLLAQIWQLYCLGVGIVELIVDSDGYIGFIIYGPTSLLLSVMCITCLLVSNKIEKLNSVTDAGFIVFKSKKGKTYLDPKERIITYRDETIRIDDIKDVELLNKSRIVAKSGIAEAIVAGALFGSIGAVAGAYAGKRDKLIEDYKIVFKTTDIYHATLFIPASYENCIKIADTVFLLRKEDQREKKEEKKYE